MKLCGWGGGGVHSEDRGGGAFRGTTGESLVVTEKPFFPTYVAVEEQETGSGS